MARIDLSKLKRYPLKTRPSQFSVKDFVKPGSETQVLDNPDLKELAEAMVTAAKHGKTVIWMMGAHFVKAKLGLYLIEFMRRKLVTHLAMNGASTIHDFEFAYHGESSEDVMAALKDGSFGMAEETGRILNETINAGAREGIGYGEAVGRLIAQSDFPYKDYSILGNAYQLGVPITVHIAIGTDIIHMHPSCDGSLLGKATYHDFLKLTETVSTLEDGVLLNVGSAVLMPEVFLKALSICRNLGYPLERFVAADLDRNATTDHFYRPHKNVVVRPTAIKGKGLLIKGNHAETIPTIYQHALKILNE